MVQVPDTWSRTKGRMQVHSPVIKHLTMLLVFEQTAHYHTKAADLAFADGDVVRARAHLMAAYHASLSQRHDYLTTIHSHNLQRYDQQWERQSLHEAQ